MSDLTDLLPRPLVRRAVEDALLEDLGRAGDITSLATIPADAQASFVMRARKPGVIAGQALAREAFASLDPEVTYRIEIGDGTRVEPCAILARASGPARALLSAERVALNFLGHLSGVATTTAAYADLIAHTKARVTCTRKTTPGLRSFEKHAVRCGGGSNHRYGLDDAILIKDNHIAVCGSVADALRRAKAFAGHLVKIEIEVDTLEQLSEVLAEGADVALLDNMAPDMLREAVAMIDGRLLAEASGNVNLDTVRDVAETGVDYISVGRFTHSAPTLDIGLDIAINA
ncbi:MAG: carboxylating nicotinate-nucleotide diphosphorylase [Pseudomonadota bacterium]